MTFISGFFYLADLGPVKEIAVGDYHLEFGQGLTLWSGIAFNRGSSAVQVKRFAGGIRPNTSTNENRYLRGAALTLGWKQLAITSFYSSNKLDASLDGIENEVTIRSLRTTGLHRTVSEITGKDAVRVQLAGGRFSFNFMNFKIGLTGMYTQLSLALNPPPDLYRTFNFKGKFMDKFWKRF